jgi:hypothetical protein
MPQFNSLLPGSYPSRLASRNSNDSLPFLLNYLSQPSQETLNSSFSCLRSSLYRLGAAPTENTVSNKFLYCYSDVFTSPLHRNSSSSIVACVLNFHGNLFTKLLPSNDRLALAFQLSGVMSHCSFLKAIHPEWPTGMPPYILFLGLCLQRL